MPVRPWLGSGEAGVELDLFALLRDADQSHWGKFLQEASRNTPEGAVEADVFSMKPHFYDEVHFEPLT